MISRTYTEGDAAEGAIGTYSLSLASISLPPTGFLALSALPIERWAETEPTGCAGLSLQLMLREMLAQLDGPPATVN